MAEKLSAGGQPLAEVLAALQALADPNRLRILDLLMQGDSCNCELNERLGLPSNLLSHHLGVLRRAGLVRSRRDAVDGRWIYYAVNKEAVTRWHAWFNEFLDPARIQQRLVLCGPEGQRPVIASPIGCDESGRTLAKVSEPSQGSKIGADIR